VVLEVFEAIRPMDLNDSDGQRCPVDDTERVRKGASKGKGTRLLLTVKPTPSSRHSTAQPKFLLSRSHILPSAAPC